LRVVTIENFGTLGPDFEGHEGYIYEGDAWLLRFTIKSPEHFFANELRNLCEVLGLNLPQIYQMTLYGGGRGLYDARLHISFETPPKDNQIEQLRIALAASSPSDYEDDELDSRFREFLKTTTPAIKSKVEKALQQEELNVSKDTQSD